MRFRMRQNTTNHVNGAVAEPPPAAVAIAPAPEPAASESSTGGPAAPAAPIPAPFAARPGGFHGPMKTQISGSEVRTERIVRQVRSEIDELRQSMAKIRDFPDDLAGLDLAAVAANPDAAAALPPALLVRALVEAHDREARLERRMRKQRERIERLEEKVRALKVERAYSRGRQATLEDVIAALHANLQDLRLFRDGAPGLASGAHPALPGAPAGDA